MANIKYGKRNQAEFMRLSEKKKKYKLANAVSGWRHGKPDALRSNKEGVEACQKNISKT